MSERQQADIRPEGDEPAGKMVIRHIKPEIMEIFDLTEFVDILCIE